MSWGLSYFYENSQLEIRKCNTIYAMRASDGRFITYMEENSLSIEINLPSLARIAYIVLHFMISSCEFS